MRLDGLAIWVYPKEKDLEAAGKALHEVLAPRWPVFAGGPPLPSMLGGVSDGCKENHDLRRLVRCGLRCLERLQKVQVTAL